ncbi:5-formyltetrahydrofolate cyclo-ligase [Rhizobium leguminosarum]|uniref:5-formyltetrahydrofolate cyclo-ligase n=1 Tax=Rhizobium leguminosarum TaxID=384 RepID=UPI001C952F19|nr:5-formyltetrahydrofolate cyclo-ligase [Rhizobium leguminosarum]MBY5368593.1 5-formyltetrahydrofolate cyclo-ligase [Rhizobium leguminosarum]
MSDDVRKISADGYASPACFMHEVDPVYMGLESHPEAVREWRKAERRRLIERRTLLGANEREQRTSLIRHHLDRLLPKIAGRNVSLYWPFLGEPDLRGWMQSAAACGATCLLPVVTEKRTPLSFRSWSVGEELTRGILNIPVPLRGEERLPDIVVAPVVGFDAQCYRLGFGGGYFDRTLASLHPRPFAIGVGFDFQEIDTIRPQDHDIPMDAIVTDVEIRFRQGVGSLAARMFEG